MEQTNGIRFSESELNEIDRLKKLYPESKAALMPVLWMAQKRWGWLSAEVMQYVAELMALPLAHVMGVASFYTMYFKKPMGKFHVQVCTNVSCMLRGGDEIYHGVSSKFQIKHNETTSDGLISLEEVECMGACGGAPMVAVNEDYYENVDWTKLETLLGGFK